MDVSPPGRIRGALASSHHHFIFPGEMKSSLPCSRDTMNSACQENKPPGPEGRTQSRFTRKPTRVSFPKEVKGGQFTVGIDPSRDLKDKALLPWSGPWLSLEL